MILAKNVKLILMSFVTLSQGKEFCYLIDGCHDHISET